jgi:hypothetical protein
MPAIQSTFLGNLAASIEGMIATSEPTHIVSKIVETAAGIGMGKAVIRGTADNQVKVSAASSKLLGVSVLDQNIRPDVDPNLFAQYDTIPVMIRGVIWVQTSVNVVAGDLAYVIPGTGLFTNISTSNYPVGVFESTGLANALVKLRVSVV